MPILEHRSQHRPSFFPSRLICPHIGRPAAWNVWSQRERPSTQPVGVNLLCAVHPLRGVNTARKTKKVLMLEMSMCIMVRAQNSRCLLSFPIATRHEFNATTVRVCVCVCVVCLCHVTLSSMYSRLTLTRCREMSSHYGTYCKNGLLSIEKRCDEAPSLSVVLLWSALEACAMRLRSKKSPISDVTEFIKEGRPSRHA